MFALWLVLSALLPGASFQEARLATLADFTAGEFSGTQAGAEGISLGLSVGSFGPVTEPALTALLTDGERVYVGTGAEGRVYVLDKGLLTLAADTEAAMVTALALFKGHLYIGTSSPAVLYVLEKSGPSKIWGGEEPYLNALQVWNDRLYWATGNPARLYRLDSGKAEPVLTVEQEAFTALAVDETGILWAGTNGNGWILKFKNDQNWEIVHRDDLPQITALSPDDAGKVYFLSGNMPKESKEVQGTLSALGMIEGERVTPLKKWDTTMMTAMAWSSELKRLIWGGSEGKLYTLSDGKMAVLAQVPQQQIAALSGEWVATQSACGLFRLEPAQEGEYLSKPFDAKRAARWGMLDWKGAGAVKAMVRFGGQEKPDAAWTPFSPPCSAPPCAAPGAGRFAQVKLVLTPGARVEYLSWAYRTVNAPPEIKAFNVMEPGEVFLKGGYAPDNVVIEAVNPDRYGMFTTLDVPPAEAKDKDKGKKYYKRGCRTFTWEVSDADGDEVQAALEFGREGQGGWMPVFEKEKGTSFAFDTQALPDGAYRFRLTVVDVPEGESAREISPLVLVDNTPPQITFARKGGDVGVEVSDALSRLWRVEWAADGKSFKALPPDDGLLDGPKEAFRIPAAEIKDRSFVVVRAADSFFNSVTVPLNVPH
jgi:hypothetical protein